MPAIAIPEEDAVRFALIHPFGREQEMELRATFGNVYRKEKRCSVRPCMPRRMLVAMQMEEFMTRRYELRFNRMKGCKEYRERHSLFTGYRRDGQEHLFRSAVGGRVGNRI